MPKTQLNRVYFDFIKLAKTVKRHGPDIRYVEIGTVSIRRWAAKHAINLTWPPDGSRPLQTQMWGIPVIWVDNLQGAKIQYNPTGDPL